MRPLALTIAGLDPSGGAGVVADVQTFHAHATRSAAVSTLLTAQNTRGITRMSLVDPTLLRAQLESILEDLPVAAIKIGALGSAETVNVVAAVLAKRPAALAVVIDPVLVSSSGAPFGDERVPSAIAERLLPLSTLVTPNASELAVLSGIPVTAVADVAIAAHRLMERGARAVLAKGGHLGDEDCVDRLFVRDRAPVLHRSPRRHDIELHGAGCTLSASIAANLAHGFPLESAVARAHEWVACAIATTSPLGAGRVPLDHFAPVDMTIDRPIDARTEHYS